MSAMDSGCKSSQGLGPEVINRSICERRDSMFVCPNSHYSKSEEVETTHVPINE